MIRLRFAVWLGATTTLVPALGLAQQGGAVPAGDAPNTPGAPYVAPAAPAGPAAPNPEGNLPSSSRSYGVGERDSFDLGSPGGSTVARGREGSAGVFRRAMRVPDVHTVQRGETLWTICSYYYGNPWAWPKVWSYNPQLQNPHWVYPGDELRLRAAGTSDGESSEAIGSSFVDRRAVVPRATVFLRNQGYIDDPKKDVWGELVGSREDQTLLAEGNHVYLTIKAGVDLRIGQMLTVFRPVRAPDRVTGGRRPPGEIISIKGTLRVEQWDPNTRVARAEIVESVDAIERGALIGPVGRRFDVVPPKKNDVEVWARVLGGVYPHEVFGANQVVFIDRGTDDGIEPGNRLLIVRKGDAWRSSLKLASRMVRQRMKVDDPGRAQSELTPVNGKENDFPEEVVGELRVLRTRKFSSIALITSSHREIEAGDRAVAKKGY